jgi:uncharacterized protein (DUF1330 family)
MTARGYWIVHVMVTDPQKYPKHIAADAAAFAEFKAQFLVLMPNLARAESTCAVTTKEQITVLSPPANKSAATDAPEARLPSVLKLFQRLADRATSLQQQL